MVSVMLDRAPVLCPAHLKTQLKTYGKKAVAFPNASSPCLLLAFLVMVPVAAYSQNDRRVGIGLGPEINMNSGSDFGVGAIVALDINFGNYWAVGLSAKGSHDLSSAWVAEGMVFIRCYVSGRDPWQREYHSGFFMQADAGAHYIVEDNVFMYEGDTLLRPMGGLRVGFRFLLGASRHFFLEPYARGGYPFLCDAGLALGVRF